ncbi:MAG: pyridoxal-phosphate dependent enzyme [Nitriliruptoraceae bacterium]
MITLDDVRDAARQLAGVAHRTPVVTSATLDELVGAQIFLKAENLQRIGAFKFRGAYNAISRLNDQQLARGVVAFSSGNHAQAVALSARLVGTTATIVMPQDTPVAKLEATQGYGADIVHYDRYTDDRVAVGERVAAERDLTLIHPYDDRYVMAGQGTAALELIEDVADLEMLVVCIGGGGLIAGCATAAKGVDSTIRMVGVEPEARDITRRSIEAGERLSMAVPHTIADGQQSDTPGRLTFEVNRRLLDDVVSVSDRDIVAAMRFMFDRVKLVTEPSGASALAAVMAGAVGDLAGRRVGVIVSGGNVGVERFVGLMNDPALNGPAGTSAHS